MESLGQFLKRERMTRGVTLEEISDNTRIKVHYLDALEREDFDILPAEAFVKGFIRAYCRYLGINQEDAIKTYNSLSGKGSAEPTTEAIGHKGHRTRREGFPRSLAAIISLTAVVVVAAVIIMLNQRGDQHGTEPLKSGTEAFSAKAGGPMKVDEEELGKTLAAGGGVEETAPPVSKSAALKIFALLHDEAQAGPKPPEFRNFYAANWKGAGGDEDHLTLTISASGEAWVQIRADDGTHEAEALLKAGEKKSWTARDKFVLTISDVTKTSITLNGQEVTIPSHQSNIIKNYTLTRERLN